jgi:hypothetical protein
MVLEDEFTQGGKTVLTRLDEARLTRIVSKPGRQESTEEYPLGTLVVAHVLMPTRRKVTRRVSLTIRPPSLVLVTLSQEGLRGEEERLRLRQRQLSRKSEKGLHSQKEKLEGRVKEWEEICDRVEREELPKALARIWPRLRPFEQYRVLVLHSEIAFLRGRIGTGRMFWASIRSIALEFWGLLAIVYILVGLLVLLILLLGFGGVNISNLPTTAVITGGVAVASVIWALSLFVPLSRHLKGDVSVQRLANRLTGAKIESKSIEHLLGFVENDIDRVKLKYGLGSLFSVAAGGLGIASELLLSTPQFVSRVLVGLASAAFFLYQLYYASHIQILQLAKTVCLVAKAEAEREADAPISGEAV